MGTPPREQRLAFIREQEAAGSALPVLLDKTSIAQEASEGLPFVLPFGKTQKSHQGKLVLLGKRQGRTGPQSGILREKYLVPSVSGLLLIVNRRLSKKLT